MASLRGQNVLIYVNDVAIAMQRDATLNMESDQFSVNWKGSDSWKSSETTYKSWSVDCDCVYNLEDSTDSDGFGVLFEAFENSTELDIVIGLGADEIALLSADDQTGFTGKCYISTYNLNFPNDDARSLSLSLVGNGKLERVYKTA
jgi:hypothetical protein